MGAVNNIIKNKESIKSLDNKQNVKNVVSSFKTRPFDNKLLEWIIFKRRKKFIVTDDILKEMALKLAKTHNILDFRVSQGWLTSFKKDMKY